MMWKRDAMPVWRFGLMVVFFLIGSVGLYVGIGQWLTEPSLSWTLPLKGEVIVVDAGHGGVDPGAVAESGVLEKDVTLKVAFMLRDYLQQAGAQVVLLRDTDKDLANENTKGYSRRKSEDLKQRVETIRAAHPSLLVSLHCNAVPSAKWSGAQTFYHGELPESKALAASIQEALRETLGMSRTITERNDIYLLKHSGVAGSLVELGFLSNPDEAQLLTQEKHQQLLTLSVYKGIVSYYADLKTYK